MAARIVNVNRRGIRVTCVTERCEAPCSLWWPIAAGQPSPRPSVSLGNVRRADGVLRFPRWLGDGPSWAQPCYRIPLQCYERGSPPWFRGTRRFWGASVADYLARL